jgi:hypothetical protein
MDLMVCPAQTDEHCLAPQQPFVAAAGWSAVLGIAGQGVKGGAERGAHHVDLDVQNPVWYNGWWSILLLGMIYSYRYLGKSCQLALVI